MNRMRWIDVALAVLLLLSVSAASGANMAHGTPDWAGTAAQSITAPVADMGELAARLKSVDVYDRRGNVILADNFDGGAQTWQFVNSGAGETIQWTSAYRSVGIGSTRIDVKGVVGSYGQAGLFAPLSVLDRVGVEFGVGMQADIGDVEIIIVANRSTAPSSA